MPSIEVEFEDDAIYEVDFEMTERAFPGYFNPITGVGEGPSGAEFAILRITRLENGNWRPVVGKEFAIIEDRIFDEYYEKMCEVADG